MGYRFKSLHVIGRKVDHMTSGDAGKGRMTQVKCLQG